MYTKVDIYLLVSAVAIALYAGFADQAQFII